MESKAGLFSWLRWWFQLFCIFIPTWGNDPIWRAYFSNGSVVYGTSIIFKKTMNKYDSPELMIDHRYNLLHLLIPVTFPRFWKACNVHEPSASYRVILYGWYGPPSTGTYSLCSFNRQTSRYGVQTLDGCFVAANLLQNDLGIWVFPKNRGIYPKMDGENNGKPY